MTWKNENFRPVKHENHENHENRLNCLNRCAPTKPGNQPKFFDRTKPGKHGKWLKFFGRVVLLVCDRTGGGHAGSRRGVLVCGG